MCPLIATLAACASSVPDVGRHALDCALGVPWSDCQPGTPGYANNGGSPIRTNVIAAERKEIHDKFDALATQCRADMPNNSSEETLSSAWHFLAGLNARTTAEPCRFNRSVQHALRSRASIVLYPQVEAATNLGHSGGDSVGRSKVRFSRRCAGLLRRGA